MTIKKMFILLFFFALVAAEPVTKSFNVKGMMCGYGCVTTINNSIKTLEGVKNCEVSFENKLMTVTFENKLLNESKIIESLPTPYIATLLVSLIKKEYEITGMHCMGCVNTLEGILKDVNGIDNFDIDFDSKSLSIEFDSTVIEEDKIKNLIPEKFTLKEKIPKSKKDA